MAPPVNPVSEEEQRYLMHTRSKNSQAFPIENAAACRPDTPVQANGRRGSGFGRRAAKDGVVDCSSVVVTAVIIQPANVIVIIKTVGPNDCEINAL
jgi:hypothetical protein